MTRRYLVPAAPVLLIIAATGIVHASTFKQKVTTTMAQTNDKPSINVNGHDLEVPTNGTTSTQEGDTRTTVSHHESIGPTADSTSTSTTTSTGGSVDISVTSSGAGRNVNHSQVNIDSSGDTATSSQSSVTITSQGEGQIQVSQ